MPGPAATVIATINEGMTDGTEARKPGQGQESIFDEVDWITYNRFHWRMIMSKVYCRNCGAGYSDARSLLANSCSRHPEGRGKHELFGGPESDVYFCKNCGSQYRDLASLTRNTCSHHPDGRGRHQPYEGGLKDEYVCQYCGRKYNDIATLTRNSCSRHPSGRGRHSPA